MPELDEFDDKIARVTPLGLSPVTDAQAMSALNQRVLDMMTARVESLGREIENLKNTHASLYATNERHVEQIESLRAALSMIAEQKSGSYQNLYNNIRAIARAALEME